jgi:gamma-carbonic anhydrase
MTEPTFLFTPPKVALSAWIAPGAVVVGDVTLHEESSVFYGAVLRGDINEIVIGPRSNVQDGAVVHLSRKFGCYVGSDVTVGHKAILHACRVQDEVLVGMGAIIMDGTEIGPQCIIGAGTVIPSGKIIPEGSLVVGNPGRVVRSLSLEERQGIKQWATNYVKLLPFYKQGNLPYAASPSAHS